MKKKSSSSKIVKKPGPSELANAQIQRLKKNGHFAKGNTMALGNDFGRPAITSDNDLEKFGQAMVDWLSNNEDAIFIQDYAIHMKMPTSIIRNWAKTRSVFLPYYEQASQICGCRMARGAGKDHGIHASLVNRFTPVYFQEVKEVELEMKGVENSNENTNVFRLLVHPDTLNIKD